MKLSSAARAAYENGERDGEMGLQTDWTIHDEGEEIGNYLDTAADGTELNKRHAVVRRMYNAGYRNAKRKN
jgi:hypothetical protein